MNDPVLGILFALGGYFLGGIMFSDIFPRVFMKKDIKSLSDDKNPGRRMFLKYAAFLWEFYVFFSIWQRDFCLYFFLCF